MVVTVHLRIKKKIYMYIYIYIYAIIPFVVFFCSSLFFSCVYNAVVRRNFGC